MKFTNNEERADKILNLLLAAAVIAILLFAGFVLLFEILRDKNLDLTQPYHAMTQEVQEDSTGHLGRGELFAEKLCVGAGSVPLEGIEIPEREKAGLFSLKDGRVLYAQNMYEKIYPASITKLVTAILAVKYGKMEDKVVITEEDLDLEEGSQMSGIQVGDKTTMDELFHVLMIYSGNDAAMAIARHIGGTVEKFVEMMNEEVRLLGATGTHFVNPSGLHDDSHYTTAYDIYLILQEALNYPKFIDCMKNTFCNFTFEKPDGTVVQKRLEATDKYLTGEKTPPKYVTVLGGKTGTTLKAGSCLAIVSQNAYGEPYISIVLNAQNKTALYRDMNLLLEQINRQA